MPLAFDFDGRLVHAPADPHRPLAAVQRLFELGTICDHPSVHRRVVDSDTAFLHEYFDMAIAQGIGHLPAHVYENDLFGEMRVRETDRYPLSPS